MNKLVSALIPFFALMLSSYCSHEPYHESTQNTVPSYDVLVRILPEAHRVEVTGTWRISPEKESRNQIEFYLSPKMRNLDVRILEPQVSAPPASLASEAAGGDTKWILTATKSIPAGVSILLQFSYESDGTSAPQFNISPDGSFAGGGGELWYPQTSFSVKETGMLSFLVGEGEKVISNGTLKSTEQEQRNGEFVFNVTEPSKFGFASGKYTVIQRRGKVPFSLYLLRPRDQAGLILNGCDKALDFLVDVFGPFPYREFSFVEVDFRSAVLGTGEYGFILADDSQLDKGFDLSYWAHEMGHQWWGTLIKSASGTTGRMMLSEGLAQFGALRAIEAIEGPEAAEQFRRYGHKTNSKQSAVGYFRLAADSMDLPITSFQPKTQDEIVNMHRLTNSKGFIVLDMLARRVGDEKFADVLKKFIKENANRRVSWLDFQDAIEAGAGQDIHWFFEQWLERTGAPEYQVLWEQRGKSVEASVTQQTPYYRAKLEVEMKGENQSLLKTFEVAGERTTVNWTVPFIVDSVLLDPHYKVLRWTPEFRAQSDSLH